jgi:hypothetical protein
MKEREGTIVELTVVGKDRSGVVASFTNAIFKHGGNIENVNQNVVHGLFGMHLESSFTQGCGEGRPSEGRSGAGTPLRYGGGPPRDKEKGKAPTWLSWSQRRATAIDEIL